MKYVPHSYQRFAEEKMLDLPAVGIFYPPGSGKTVATLTTVWRLIYDFFEVRRCLVIAPLKVAEDTWSTEADKWEHLRELSIAKALGPAARRRAAIESGTDVTVINRENVAWLVENYRKHWPFDMVVIDELSNFKSNQAQRFRAMKQIRPLVRHIVGLTGTPSAEGLIDLWAQLYLLDGGERLGKFITHYREHYFMPDKRNATTIFSWKPKPGAEQAIYQKISDICFSVSQEDLPKLPDRQDIVVPVALPAGAAAAYKQLEKELILQLASEDVIKAGTAATLANKLQQFANGAVYTEQGAVEQIHDAKLDALEAIVKRETPVLVFYRYRHDVERIMRRLPQAQLLTEKMIPEWNAGRIPVLLAHPASCGYGLNLQAGGHVIVWFGPTWSLEQDQQANARLYRQGQAHPVTVYYLTAKGTVDDDIVKALQRKATGQDALLDAVHARLEAYRVADATSQSPASPALETLHTPTDS